jgi:flagellar hook-length control protein FliK
MPELMINAAPTPSANGTGNARSVSPSESGNRSEAGAKADTPNATPSPFAAVLKSRMEKKQASATPADNAQPATAAEIAKDTPVNVDLAAFLPLLDANQAATATTAATAEQAVDTALQAELQSAAAQANALCLAAPAPMAAAVSPAPTFVSDKAPRKQSVEALEPLLTAVASAKSEAAALTSGKIALDAAIYADTRRGDNAAADAAADFHALLDRATALTAGASAGAGATASTPSLRIDTPLGKAGWYEDVGQKLTWMVHNNRQQADLVLNPPQLGRIEVSLTMNGDQASATFTSANPAVREALENSLQRLREVLADAGVTLGQTQVGSQSQQQAWRQEAADFGASEGIRYASTIPVPGPAAVAATSTGRGMIDVFA